MILIVEAECFRCGQPLKIDPGIDRYGPSPVSTGGPVFEGHTGRVDGRSAVQNILVCDEYLAEHPR